LQKSRFYFQIFKLSIILGGIIAAAGALAQNFPRPEFRGGQTFPEQIHPLPRAAWLSYLDVGMLMAALLAAVFFSLRLRSRPALVALALFSLAYFGFYRHGCVCPIGAIQNVAYALGDNGYTLPIPVGLFFALPLLFALFVGRTFCAGVCPLGALQEIVLWRPVRVPEWLDNILSVFPFLFAGFAIFYAAIGSTFLICRFDPFVEFFRLGGTLGMLLVGAGLLLLGLFVGRPYCRYLCPLSAFLRLFAALARWQPQITTGDCIQCHLCAEACPYGAIKSPTASEPRFPLRRARRSLIIQLCLLPLFVGIGAGLLRLNSLALAQLDPRVQLAQELWLYEKGFITKPTARIEAFNNRELPTSYAYWQGTVIQKWFDVGSWLLGGWIGLVFGLKMMGMSLRRQRRLYMIDSASCVHCGRCYNICPLQAPGKT